MSQLHDLSQSELRNHDKLLRSAARRITGCEHFAEEITQEVWLEAFREPPKHTRNLQAWLRIVALRAAFRLRKRDANRRDRERTTARPETTRSPENERNLQALSRRIHIAIGSLDEPYRKVVRLRFEDGLSGTDIASVLGRSENTVRSQLRRGLQKLRVLLGEDEHQSFLSGVIGLLFARLLGRPLQRVTVLRACGLLLVICAPLLLVDFENTESAGAISEVRGTNYPQFAENFGRPQEVARTARQEVAVLRGNAQAAQDHPGSELAAKGQVLIGDAPCPGAQIWVAPSGQVRAGRIACLAAEDGSFEIPDLDATSWIWADTPGYAPSKCDRLDSLPAERRRDLKLILGKRIGQLSISVLDSTGHPVPDAEVSFDLPTRSPFRGARGTLEYLPLAQTETTDADGFVFLDQPNAQRCNVLVRSPGYVTASIPTQFPKGRSDQTVEIRLPEPASIFGRVLASNGRAVAGAAVRLVSEGSLPALRTTTDRAGCFQIHHLQPTARTIVVAATRASPGTALQRVELASGSNPQFLELDASLGIAGKLAHASGSVSNARVEAWSLPSKPGRKPLTTYPDSSGSFRFDGAVGRYELYVYAGSSEQRFPVHRVAEVSSGWKGVIELETSTPPESLSGRIDLTSSEIETVLELRSPEIPEPVALSIHTDGSFALDNLPSGEYELRATVPLRGPIAVKCFVLNRGETIDLGTLTVPKPASFRILVSTADDEPVRFRQSGLRNDDRKLLSSPQDGSDSVEFRINEQFLSVVPPGEYLVRVRMLDHATVLRSVRLEEGEAGVLQIDAVPGKTVNCNLSLPAPLPQSTVFRCVHEHEGTTRTLDDLFVPMLGSVRRRVFMEWALGSHKIEAWTSTGLRGSVTFEVTSDSAPKEVMLTLK